MAFGQPGVARQPAYVRPVDRLGQVTTADRPAYQLRLQF
jgi:hypothetical protein